MEYTPTRHLVRKLICSGASDELGNVPAVERKSYSGTLLPRLCGEEGLEMRESVKCEVGRAKCEWYRSRPSNFFLHSSHFQGSSPRSGARRASVSRSLIFLGAIRKGFAAPTNHLAMMIITCILLFATATHASELEGFTEPYRQVAVPAAEIGVLEEILVTEGDQVSQKQLLARLDDEVLQASLEVARAAKDAMGARLGAQAELDIRDKQRESYRDLHEQGNVSQREIDRIESSYQQAAARLQSVREELDVRRLEFERVKSQIRQRRIESPIDGHIIAIVKERGEFVSPTDPVVMHIAQLDTLKAVFSVPIQVASELQPNQNATLQVGTSGTLCKGVIEFVSPIAEAESASVRVKIRIPNPSGSIPSGATCRWDLQTEDVPEQVTRRPVFGSR